MLSVDFRSDQLLQSTYKQSEGEGNNAPITSTDKTILHDPVLNHFKELLDHDLLLHEILTENPLPPLNKQVQIKILKLLTKNFIVRANDESFELEITPYGLFKYLFECINKNSSLNIEKIEIVGGTVLWLLKDYLEIVLDKLGIKNYKEILTPELMKEWDAMPPDVDIRFSIPKAQKNELENLNSLVVEYLAKQKSKGPPSKEIKKLIRHQAFLNYMTTYKENYYSTVSVGDRKGGTNLDLLFVCFLKRLNLFIQDGLRINISPIFEALKEKNGNVNSLIRAITREEIKLDIIPESLFRNGWQALIDRLTKIVRAENPETINEAGWSRLMTAYTKGKRSVQKDLESILLATFEKASPPKGGMLGTALFWLKKSLINHLPNNPEAAFALAFNACLSLQPSFPEVVLPLWESLRSHFAESSNPFLAIIDTLVTENNGDFNKISALIQAKAFFQFSSDQYDSKLLIHNGKPALQLKIGESHILLPFDPVVAFKELAEDIDESKYNLLISKKSYVLSNTLKGLPIDWRELEKIAHEMIENKNFIGYDLLIACCVQMQNENAFDVLIDQIPFFISYPYKMVSLKNLALTPHAANVLDQYDSLPDLYSDEINRWAHALACSGSELYASKASRLWKCQNNKTQLNLTFIKNLAFTRPDKAMSFLLEMKNEKEMIGYLVEGWLSICQACKMRNKTSIDLPVLTKGFNKILKILMHEKAFNEALQLLKLFLKSEYDLLQEVSFKKKVTYLFDTFLNMDMLEEVCILLTQPKILCLFDESESTLLRCKFLEKAFLTNRKQYQSKMNIELEIILGNFDKIDDTAIISLTNFLCKFLEFCPLSIKLQIDKSITNILKALIKSKDKNLINNLLIQRSFADPLNRLNWFKKNLSELKKLLHPKFIANLLSIISNEILNSKTNSKELCTLLKLYKSSKSVPAEKWAELMKKITLQKDKRLQIKCYEYLLYLEEKGFLKNDLESRVDCWINCLEGMNEIPNDCFISIYENISSFIDVFKDPSVLEKRNKAISLALNYVNSNYTLKHHQIFISAIEKLQAEFGKDDQIKKKIEFFYFNLCTYSNDLEKLEKVCNQFYSILQNDDSNDDIENAVLNFFKGLNKLIISSRSTIFSSAVNLLKLVQEKCNLNKIGYPILLYLGMHNNTKLVSHSFQLLTHLLDVGIFHKESIHQLLENAVNYHFDSTFSMIKQMLNDKKLEPIHQEEWFSDIVYTYIKKYQTLTSSKPDNIKMLKDLINLISVNLKFLGKNKLYQKKSIKIALKSIYKIGLKKHKKIAEMSTEFFNAIENRLPPESHEGVDFYKIYFSNKIVNTQFSSTTQKVNFTDLVYNLISSMINEKNKNYKLLYNIIEKYAFITFKNEEEIEYGQHLNKLKEMLSNAFSKDILNPEHLVRVIFHADIEVHMKMPSTPKHLLVQPLKDKILDLLKRDNFESLKEAIFMFQKGKTPLLNLHPKTLLECYQQTIRKIKCLSKTPEEKLKYLNYLQEGVTLDYKYSINTFVRPYVSGKWEDISHQVFKEIVKAIMMIAPIKDPKLLEEILITLLKFDSVFINKNGYSEEFMKLFNKLDAFFYVSGIDPKKYKSLFKLYYLVVTSLYIEGSLVGFMQLLKNPQLIIPPLLLGLSSGFMFSYSTKLPKMLNGDYSSPEPSQIPIYASILSTLIPAFLMKGKWTKFHFFPAIMGSITGLLIASPFLVGINLFDENENSRNFRNHLLNICVGTISWTIAGILSSCSPLISIPKFPDKPFQMQDLKKKNPVAVL